MKAKTFWVVFLSVLAVCLALTVAHFIFAVYACECCSIINFDGKELW